MKNEWKNDSDLAKKIHEMWIGGGPVVPVFNEPKVEMIHMDTVHEWQLKDNDVIILTAHAGAGKSTTIKGIIELWKDKYIGCCALAAKAAIRIKEATGMDSFTIHRLLNFKNGRFLYDDKNPLPYDIIIVDECSMINVGLFLSLLKAVKSGGKIVLVFDDAQLPAIGAGSVAKDLLTSNFCIKRLTKIHRQAAKSGIKIDANNIRQQIDVFAVGNDYDSSGKLPLHITHGEKHDMHYYNLLNAESIHTQAIMLYKELIKGGGVGGECLSGQISCGQGTSGATGPTG